MSKNKYEYTFHYDVGDKVRKSVLTYDEYLKNNEIRRRIWKPGFRRVFMGRDIALFSWHFLKKHPSKKKLMDEYEDIVRRYRFSVFAPSGPSVERFINDDKHDVTIFQAPNGVGKTASGVIKAILDLIPTDPTWPIFSKYGIKHRLFEGPKSLAVLTYKWGTMKKVLWKEIQKWMPDHELGPYSPYYTGRSKKTLSFERTQVLPLNCGSEIAFYVYEQDPDTFEGAAHNTVLWDEQGKEFIFDGMDERVRRRNGKHIFVLTPHYVPGRPDTGSGSFIHKLTTGEQTKGHSVMNYKLSVSEVPDWIYPEDKKEAAYEKWVSEPRRSANLSKLREGRARYYGEWHASSGLVYDEWDRSEHLIDPFPIPKDWTKYRGIDHGTVNPTACIWAAVSPQNYIYLYREYYERGPGIYQHVSNIINYSGNHAKRMQDIHMGFQVYPQFEEAEQGEIYHMTVMDPRSFSMNEGSGVKIGQLYRWGGLKVKKASGKHSEGRIPIVKDCLTPKPDRKHPVLGTSPAPRLYVFNTLRFFISEIQGYIWDVYSGAGHETHNAKEKPRAKDDHLINALEYLIMANPRYYGDKYNKEFRAYEYDAPQPRFEMTGY